MPDINIQVFEEAKRNQLVTEIDVQTQVALDDYQVQLSDITNSTQSQDNVVIDRFGEFLPHWNESLDFDTWVKMSMELAGKKLLMIHGNEGLSSESNGENTFIQFDNFESYADTAALFADAKWTNVYGSPVLGITHVYAGTKGLEINGLDWAGWSIPDDADYIFDFEGRYDSIEADTWGISGRDAGTQIAGTPYMTNTYWSGTTVIPKGEDVFHHFSISYINSDNKYTWSEDGDIVEENKAYSTSGAIDQVRMGRSLGYYDNVRIRKYTATEPILQIGTPKNISTALKSFGRAG